MNRVELICRTDKMIKYQVTFDSNTVQVVPIKLINMKHQFILLPYYHKHTYCNGPEVPHLQLHQLNEEEDIQKLILKMAIYKIQLHDREYDQKIFSNKYLYDFDGIIYQNYLVSLQYCGIQCRQYIKLIAKHQYQISKELRRLRDLVPNLRQRKIQHSQPSIHNIKYIYINKEEVYKVYIKPIFNIVNTTHIMQHIPESHTQIQTVQGIIRQLQRQYGNEDRIYLREQQVLKKYYYNCVHYDQQAYKTIQAIIKVPKIYALMLTSNYLQFKEQINKLLNTKVPANAQTMQIYIRKWKQLHDQYDINYIKYRLQQNARQQQIMLQIQNHKIQDRSYKPQPQYNKLLGWAQLNINYHQQHNNQQQLYKSLTQYCKCLSKYPNKQAKLRYHFYKYKLLKHREHYNQAKYHLLLCNAYTTNIQQQITIYHELGLICGELLQYEQQLQYYWKCLKHKQNKYGLYHIRNLSTLYNIIYALINNHHTKHNNGKIKMYVHRLKKIKKRIGQEQYLQWLKKNNNRLDFICKIQQKLQQQQYIIIPQKIKNIFYCKLSELINKSNNINHEERLTKYKSNDVLEINRKNQVVSVYKAYLQYIFNHNHPNIHNYNYDLYSNRNIVRLKFLQAQYLVENNQKEGLCALQTLVNDNIQENTQKYYIREHLVNVYRHMGIYWRILDNYYLYKMRALGMQPQNVHKCIQFAMLYLYVGTSDGTKNYSQPHRVLSMFAQSEQSSVLYLYAVTNQYYQKYNKTIQLLNKIIEKSVGEQKQNGRYKQFIQCFNTIDNKIHRITGKEILQLLFRAYFKTKNYQQCYSILQKGNIFSQPMQLKQTNIMIMATYNQTQQYDKLNKKYQMQKGNGEMVMCADMIRIVYRVQKIKGVQEVCRWIIHNPYQESQDLQLISVQFWQQLLSILLHDKQKSSILLRIIGKILNKIQTFYTIINHNIDSIVQYLCNNAQYGGNQGIFMQMLDLCERVRGQKSHYVLQIYKSMIGHYHKHNYESQVILLSTYIKEQQMYIPYLKNCLLQTQQYQIRREQLKDRKWYESTNVNINNTIQQFINLKHKINSLQQAQAYDEEEITEEINNYRWNLQKVFPKPYLPTLRLLVQELQIILENSY